MVLRTAREVFDANKICTGCPTASELAGDAVTTSPQTQLHPSISGNRVLWLDLSATTDFAGLRRGHHARRLRARRCRRRPTPSRSPSPATRSCRSTSAAGSPAPTARDSTVIDTVRPEATLAAGFSGSDAGAAWLLAAPP